MNRLFIFDYDGTLCATRDAICATLVHVFHEWLGHAVSQTQVVSLVARGLGLTHTIHELHPAPGTLTARELDAWQNRYREIYQDIAETEVKVFPQAVEMVAACAELGAVAVVSNKGIAALRHSLIHLGFSAYAQAIFADDGHTPRKPNPELYSKHVRAAFPHTAPQDTLMIGDTEVDLRFARNAGIRSCWAKYGYGDPEACRAIGYDYQIATLSELRAVVDRGA